MVLPGPPSMNIRGYGFVWNLQGIGKAKGCWKTVEGARRGGKVNAQPRAGVGVLGAQGWVLQGMRNWEKVLWLELWVNAIGKDPWVPGMCGWSQGSSQVPLEAAGKSQRIQQVAQCCLSASERAERFPSGFSRSPALPPKAGMLQLIPPASLAFSSSLNGVF